MSTDTGPDTELSSQWSNPGDILSLLLLIGGDIVQKAIAQIVGFHIKPFRKGPSIFLTPVAFSFGWVAYSFTSLMAIVGENRLMPDAPDVPSIVVNCDNAYTRENHSWLLGRILRDHEASHRVDWRKVSLRIDIFVATGIDKRPDIDPKWLVSWLVIMLQLVLAAVPWIIYGDWAILMVTFAGTVAALTVGMLPQWTGEKWASRRITTNKIVALTRGNGHHHVMLFINNKNNPPGWDVEALASSSGESYPETRWVCGVLAIWWVLLLITVSGLKAHSWFLIGVGGIGMLQNIYLAGASRKAGAFNFHFVPHPEYPVIEGLRLNQKSKVPLAELFQPGDEFVPEKEKIGGVMGALMALEERIPRAGASLMTVFFPGTLAYEPGRFKFQWEKDYWTGVFEKWEIPQGNGARGPPPVDAKGPRP
jgi:hypothetical protein